MSHPFTKIFERVLKKSTPLDNQVVVEAEKILEKGYAHDEVLGVLKKLEKGLIDDAESELVREAVEILEDGEDE